MTHTDGRRSLRRRWVAWSTLVLFLCALAASLTLDRLRRHYDTTALPPVPPVAIGRIFPSPSPIRITVTADWLKVPIMVFPSMIVSDPGLWRRMRFDDWDTVPTPLRREGLQAVLSAYSLPLRSPRVWDSMDASDWDAVPHPVRVIAYMNMMRYWSGYYQVGARYALPRGTVTNTLNAILMVESWFEHRAVSVSRSGNRDLGLGQTSDYARAAMQRLFQRGAIDFSPTDDSLYDNPWIATRMTAIWFDLMLDEQGGDLDTAIRAYHAGAPQSESAAAEAYWSNVLQKRRRFMRDKDGTPSWQLLISLGDNPAVLDGIPPDRLPSAAR